VRGVAEKTFGTVGGWTEGTLFGQHLFPSGGKYLTITEGEFDALAVYQLTGSKYPAVSIRNGAASALKDCKAQYEYINSFDNIIICFDGDEPGMKAAAEVAELFGGQAKVFKPLPEYKDPCDWLSDSKDALFVQRCGLLRLTYQMALYVATHCGKRCLSLWHLPTASILGQV